MNKPSSLSSPARAAILREYRQLQLAWHDLTEGQITDWPALFDVHYQLLKIERTHPWVRKAEV